MTCRDLIDFLMAYLDDELPTEQRAAFEMHLLECPDCVVYREQYEKTVRLEKSALSPDTDPAARFFNGLLGGNA